MPPNEAMRAAAIGRNSPAIQLWNKKAFWAEEYEVNAKLHR